MSPGPVALIGNPAAGRGRGARLLAWAARRLQEQGCDLRVHPTAAPGQAEALAAAAAAAGAALVLAAGGDGTVRDCAAGLAGVAAAPPLGILPVGTGNDLARTLGIPRSPEAALEVALGGRERAIDLWRWNATPFVNVAGVGLDAAVAEAVNARFRRLRGPLPYVLGLLTVLPVFRKFDLAVAGPEGEWRGPAWLAACANGAAYGGGMRIAPAAQPDDGMLDVVVVGDVSRLELLRQFPGIFAGRHVAHPRVVALRLSAARVETPGAPPSRPTLDGELLDRVPATVTRASRPLVVRVPAGPANEGAALRPSNG